jgi:hypothetical protein
MNVERLGPAISLLNDGRVFVVGGYTSGGRYTDQVETFDPQLEQFMLIDNTGTITDEVYRGSIGTIQNGDVLIVGRNTIYVYYYATNDIKRVDLLRGQNYSDLLGRTITIWPDGKFLVVKGSTAAFGSCIKGDK